MTNEDSLEKPPLGQKNKPEVISELGKKTPEQFDVAVKPDKSMEKAPAKAAPVTPSAKATPVTKPKEAEQKAKSENLIKIEKILSENLQEYYAQMPDDLKVTFRNKGEETARLVEAMLKKVKVNVRKIVAVIFKWLSIIPGINKFFIEQEAKIKTDKLLKEARDLSQYWEK